MDKKVSATKQKLLDISTQLMMSKGYNATTVEEVCKMADVTKGAFFHYFKTKEDLGVNVLHAYWQKRYRQFSESDWMNADHPREQIRQFLMMIADVFMNDANGFTCLAGSFAMELANTSTVFRQLVSDLFHEWTEQVKPILQSAKMRASAPDHIDVDSLADYIIVVVEGALVLALARQDRFVIQNQLNTLNTHMQLVLA